MAQHVFVPTWERVWKSPTRQRPGSRGSVGRDRSRPASRERQLALTQGPPRPVSPNSGGFALATLNGLPMVSSGERRSSPGPPSLRGDLYRPGPGEGGGSAVFDLLNPETGLQQIENPKHLQGLVHGKLYTRPPPTLLFSRGRS